MRRGTAIAHAVLGLAILLAAATAVAQPYPTRPVTLVVPFPPGGVTDLVGRLLARRLGAELGHTVVVENRAGASTIVAAQTVAGAPKDGHTLLLAAGSTLASNPHLYRRLPYRADDFAPVSLVVTLPYVISLRLDMPQSVPEFVAHAKARPGALTYGTVGVGSTSHIAAEILAEALGIEMTDVPYRGSAPALNDLLAGRIDLLVDTIATSLPLHREGRLRILSVMSEHRIPDAPDIPTFAEHGFADAVAGSWFALVAPAGTPAPVLVRLNAATAAALGDEALQRELRASGAVPAPGTPEALAAFIAAESARWGAVIRRLGITLD
jgi:tripartite-type tricarboxylate transporter receptor subunit TctC